MSIKYVNTIKHCKEFQCSTSTVSNGSESITTMSLKL